jgi:predicted transcriptional regulator
MQSIKQDIKNMIDGLPENASYDDIIEAIYVQQKIQRGLRDSEEGNYYTHAEAKALLKKWLKSDG